MLCRACEKHREAKSGMFVCPTCAALVCIACVWSCTTELPWGGWNTHRACWRCMPLETCSTCGEDRCEDCMEDHALCCEGPSLGACDDDAAMGAAPDEAEARHEVRRGDRGAAFHRLFHTPLLTVPDDVWSCVADHMLDEQSVSALDRVCTSARRGVRASLGAWSALASGAGICVPHLPPASPFSLSDVARHAYIEFRREQTAFQVGMEQLPTLDNDRVARLGMKIFPLRHVYQAEPTSVHYRAILDAARAAARAVGGLHKFACCRVIPTISRRLILHHQDTVNFMSGLAAVYAAVHRPIRVVLFVDGSSRSLSDFLQDLIPESWVTFKRALPDPYFMNRLTNLGPVTMSQERGDGGSSTKDTPCRVEMKKPNLEEIGLINQSSICFLFDEDFLGRPAADLVIATAVPSTASAISFFAYCKDRNVPMLGVATEEMPGRSAALRSFVLASTLALAGVS